MDAIKLTETFGALAVAYGPAVNRLGRAALDNLEALIAAGKRREALNELRATMTGEELATEKHALMGLSVTLADEHHDIGQTLIQVAVAILKAILGVVVAL